ncbi:MAG: alpha/beta hydrolase [Calditrichia bacterium]
MSLDMLSNPNKLILGVIIPLIFFACSETVDPPLNTQYQSSEVFFPTPDSLVLEGTLYSPFNQPRAAVVIVPGSGPVDRDGIVQGGSGTMPAIYKFWADDLVSQDVAVLRYDKRFITYSNLDPLQLSQEDQISDIVAAVNFLRNQTDLDSQNIFLIGHSEGGNIVPVAAGRLSNIAGLVILAAPAIAIDTLVVEQLRANPNVSETVVNDVQLAFGLIRSGQFPVGGAILGAGESYWQEWMLYSEKADSVLQASGVPAFILQGCSDENFPLGTLNKNKTAWQQIASGQTAFRWTAYPNVTHLILKDGENSPAENVLSDVFNWIVR